MSTDRSQGASPDSNSGRLSVRLSPRLLSRLGAAVEDGPYHSRSHLVRAALQLLLPAADDRPDESRMAPDDAARTAPDEGCPDGVRIGTIREVREAERSPHVAVELIDDRAATRATHAFVYDVDLASRTATFRFYEPPSQLTHDRIGSLGVLRGAAEAALEARNWQVRGRSTGDGADASDEDGRETDERIPPEL